MYASTMATVRPPDVGPKPAGVVVTVGLPAASVRTSDLHAALPAAGAPHIFAEYRCPVGEGATLATVVATIVVRLARVAAETVRRARWRLNEPALLWNQEF